MNSTVLECKGKVKLDYFFRKFCCLIPLRVSFWSCPLRSKRNLQVYHDIERQSKRMDRNTQASHLMPE